MVAVHPLSPFDIQQMLSRWNFALYHCRPTDLNALQAKHALKLCEFFQLLKRA